MVDELRDGKFHEGDGVCVRRKVNGPCFADVKSVPADRFPLTMAARTTRMGLACGLTYGLAQDALSLIKGRRLDYVDWMLGRRKTALDAEA